MTSLASLGPAGLSLLAVVLCAACGARSDLEGASGASAKSACAPSPTPRTLYTADFLAEELMGDGDRVYALSIQETPDYTNRIERIDPCTGEAVALGDATPFDANDPPVVAAGGSVYWVSMGVPPGPAQTLQRASPGGGAATIVMATGDQVDAMAIADGTFFGVGITDFSLPLFSVPLGGGARTELAPNAWLVNPIVDGSVVYYALIGNGIGRVTTAGEAMPPLLTTEQAFCDGDSTLRSMASDAEAIYTFTRDAFHLWRIPKDGSAPTLLVTSTRCSQIAIDDAYVYFTSSSDGDGAIHRVPKTGGTVETLASETDPGGIVVDENSVYWVHHATTVMKLDK